MMTTFLAGLMTLVASSPLAAQAPVAIAALACLTLLMTVAGVTCMLRSHRLHQALMQRLEGKRHAVFEGSKDMTTAFCRWLFKMLKAVGEANKPHSDKKLSLVRRRLVQAGYRSPDATGIFFGVKIYLALFVPVAYVALRSLSLRALPTTAFLIVLLAVVGFYAPDIWVKMKMRHRQQKMFTGFPDALDLMVICIEASLSLDAAIHKVTEESQLTNRVVSEEFKLLALGLRAGQSRQLALLSLSQRVDVQEINNFVDLMIQTEQFGTSIAQALRVQADAMRLKKRLHAEEKANELPVKLLFPLLLFIFPSLLLIILGPGIIRLMGVLSHLIKSDPIH